MAGKKHFENYIRRAAFHEIVDRARKDKRGGLATHQRAGWCIHGQPCGVSGKRACVRFDNQIVGRNQKCATEGIDGNGPCPYFEYRAPLAEKDSADVGEETRRFDSGRANLDVETQLVTAIDHGRALDAFWRAVDQLEEPRRTAVIRWLRDGWSLREVERVYGVSKFVLKRTQGMLQDEIGGDYDPAA